MTLLLHSGLYAQLVPFRQDYKWGYKNLETGNIIEPQFDLVTEFNQWGMAVVTSDKGDQIMDTNGVFLTQPNHEVYIPFSKTLYYTLDKEHKTMNLKCYSNHVSLQEKLTDLKVINEFKSTYYQATGPNGTGILNGKGEVVVPLTYQSIKIEDKRFFARSDAKGITFTYTVDGEIIDSGNYASYTQTSDGFVVTSASGKKMGLMNQNKQVIVPPHWDKYIATDYPNYYIVYNEGKKPHLFNVALQKTVDPFPFTSFVSYKTGFIKLYNGKKYGLIDFEGNVVLQDTFDLIEPWTENAIVAKVSKRYGVFDGKGTLKSGLIYRHIVPIESNKVGLFVNEKGLCGIYNSKGKNIIPCEHRVIERSGNIFRTKKGDITMHYTVDNNGNIVSSKEIKNLHVLSLNKFKLRDKFENVYTGSERKQRETMQNFDPLTVKNDSLGIHLQLQGTWRSGYRTYDLKRDKALTDYMLDYFDITKLQNNRLTVVPIRSIRRNNIILTYRGSIRNVFKWRGRTFRITEVKDRGFFIEFYSKINPGMVGLIDKKTGRVVLPPVYEIIQSIDVKNGVIIAKMNGLGRGWGAVSTSGDELVPFIHSKIEFDNETNPRFIKTYVKDEKVGMVDSLGHEITEIKYEKTGTFEQGFAPVRYQKKWTFIDQKGTELFDPKYELVKPFANGLAPVRLANRWGFIDTTGTEVIKRWYENVGPFGNGLAPVKTEELYGYINQSGDLIIPEKFKLAYPFKNGLAVVKKRDGLGNRSKYGIIDTKGNWVVNPKYRYIDRMQEGFDLKKGRKKHYLCSEGGEVYTKEFYRSVYYLNEGRYSVKKRRHRKITDALGNVKTNQRIYHTSHFVMGFAWVKTRRGWGIVDTSGTMVVADTFQYHWDFSAEGIGYGKSKHGTYTLHIENGKVVFQNSSWSYEPPKSEFVGKFGNKKIYRTSRYTGPSTYISDYQGLRDEHGKSLLPDYYNHISNFVNGFGEVGVKETRGLYQLDGTKTCNAEYEYVKAINTSKGLVFMVRKGGKIGYLDRDGNWILELAN